MRFLGSVLALVAMGLLIVSSAAMFSEETWVQLLQGRLAVMCIATGVTAIALIAAAALSFMMNPEGM